MALGGGFPRGKCSIIYGPESSNKTNIALLAIANHQRIWPDLKCVFVDIEGSFDPKWAAQLGVDVSKLLVVRPDYAEQVVNIVESLLHAQDCGIIVIDSLAAMITTQEADSDAEKANVGGTGLVTGKLVRKTTLGLNSAAKEGRQPTLIYINQTRMKIGVMYGNPETQPGGNAPQFQASIRLRVYGKNIMDSKISSTMPVIKEVTFVLNKWKVPVLAASGKFEMVTQMFNGYPIGFCNDFNEVSGHLKDFGLFHKGPKDKGWVILGETYNKIDEFKAKFYGDPLFATEVRQGIIDKFLTSGEVLEEGGSDVD
jgi:recombination protein RecA